MNVQSLVPYPKLSSQATVIWRVPHTPGFHFFISHHWRLSLCTEPRAREHCPPPQLCYQNSPTYLAKSYLNMVNHHDDSQSKNPSKSWNIMEENTIAIIMVKKKRLCQKSKNRHGWEQLEKCIHCESTLHKIGQIKMQKPGLRSFKVKLRWIKVN